MKRKETNGGTENKRAKKEETRKEGGSGGAGMKDIFGNPIEPLGTWDAPNEDVLVFVPKDAVNRSKIAAFDMDGTLITTKTGKVFPVDTTDWKLWSDDVRPKLRKLHEEGDTKLVIFTNQKGIQTKKVDKGAFKKKIEAIVRKIGVPIQVYISIGDGRYRKPLPGMWELLEKTGNDKVDIDKEASVYVGDAAGRHPGKDRKKDHSFADRLFARNIGLRFETPEQFFLGDKQDHPWGPLPFCPHELRKHKKSLLEPEDTPLPSEKQEVIVMVGFPGSGKSSFAKKLEDDYGYVVVNRDKLGTWQKCVAVAREALREGKSVVVDNTNPDIESRRRYIVLAKEMGSIPVRCFEMNVTMHQAMHNVKYRMMTRGGPDVGTMVLRMHASKLEKPALTEGFQSIVQVNFIPNFENEEDEKTYFQYMLE